ncbi:hypothetical protein [Persicobacter diffluens]|uniref:Uncharacterized protein n=1 Tax=Persicobacter diffluens TaxID=981 RepID=A0AAN4W5I4_9BACT|nr:hypothetical protein PEDI_52640 [Persicobacter diffluens]
MIFFNNENPHKVRRKILEIASNHNVESLFKRCHKKCIKKATTVHFSRKWDGYDFVGISKKMSGGATAILFVKIPTTYGKNYYMSTEVTSQQTSFTCGHVIDRVTTRSERQITKMIDIAKFLNDCENSTDITIDGNSFEANFIRLTKYGVLLGDRVNGNQGICSSRDIIPIFKTFISEKMLLPFQKEKIAKWFNQLPKDEILWAEENIFINWENKLY